MARAPDYCFDLFLSVGSTFFIDQDGLEVLEIEDDYIKLYDAEGVTHIITVDCSVSVG